MSRAEWWWRRAIPAVLWIAMILMIASLPASFFFGSGPRVAYGMPRAALQFPYHVSAFIVLAILLARCIAWPGSGTSVGRTVVLVLLGALAVSICSEVIQFWVPSRTPAARDVGLDVSGAVLGLVLVRGAGTRRLRRRGACAEDVT
jgi:hypothetical protein